VFLAVGVAGCSSGAAAPDGGAAGTAGGRGVGGAGGVGAAAAAGRVGADGAPYHVSDASADGPGSATAQFILVYNGTLTSHLTTCFDCSGLYASNGYATLMLEMENSAGAPYTTTVNVQIGPGVQGATYAVLVGVLEYNPPLGPMYQGVYGYANGVNWMNVSPGACVTFSRLEMAPGGGVTASVDCDLMGSGVNNDKTGAHLSGTFSAQFAN
jgi:hypothetical protein